MHILWGGGPQPVTPEVSRVSSTAVRVVDDQAPAAVEETRPHDTTGVVTDPRSPGGLTDHQLASFVIPSERAPARLDASSNEQNAHNSIVDDKISVVGHAAAKEARDGYGKGTFKVVVGLQPALIDGTDFLDVYATAPPRPDNHSDLSLTSSALNADPTIEALIAQSRANTKQAIETSQYSAFIDGMTRG